DEVWVAVDPAVAAWVAVARRLLALPVRLAAEGGHAEEVHLGDAPTDAVAGTGIARSGEHAAVAVALGESLRAVAPVVPVAGVGEAGAPPVVGHVDAVVALAAAPVDRCPLVDRFLGVHPGLGVGHHTLGVGGSG